jgi:hypothetical protein
MAERLFSFPSNARQIIEGISRDTGKSVDELLESLYRATERESRKCTAPKGSFRIICFDNFDMVEFFTLGKTKDVCCGEYSALQQAKQEVGRLTRESMSKAALPEDIKDYRIYNERGEYLEDDAWQDV